MLHTVRGGTSGGACRAGLLAGALGLVLAALPAPAQAVVAHHRGADASRAALDDYWTAERLRAAEPRPLPMRHAPAPPAAAATAARGPEPYGTYEVADPQAFPNSTTGRVFGRDAGGDYSCSATVVHSKIKTMLFTAAHCVRTRRLGWARKFVFIPAYEQGRAPFGRWQWRSFYLPRGWSGFSHDYAAVKLARIRGRSVEGRVGAARLAPNTGRSHDYRALGYPLNFYDGRRMMGCFSQFATSDNSAGRPRPVGIECDMTGGASGGGWLIGGTRLASVTSYGLTGQPGVLYGPYLTRRAAKLLRFAVRD
jgi:V8-like Glu-specific endopeptidase